MKAEHRKELQTNSLASYLARAIDHLKSGHTTTIILGIAVAVVLLYAAWRYFGGRGASSSTQLWIKLDQITADDQLKPFADAYPGTTQGRTAKFWEARALSQRGPEKLGNPDERAKAVQDLIKARELYQELAPLCRAEPILQQEAMMGVARAEESLIGVPDPADPKQPAGTLDRAVAYYEELAVKFPESAQGKAARQRADDLKKNPEKIQSFYAKLNKADSKE